jgi:hypothetical protein
MIALSDMISSLLAKSKLGSLSLTGYGLNNRLGYFLLLGIPGLYTLAHG